MKKNLLVIKKRKWISLALFLVILIGCLGMTDSGIVHGSEGITAKATVEEYISKKEAPTENGSLFAGWFEDAAYTKPIKTVEQIPSDGAYAKFVDENILSVRLQTKTMDDGSTNMRVISSVDSQQYYRVGFEIQFDGGNSYTFETWKIMERIQATEASGHLTYNYSPNVISPDSAYFVSVTITGINSAKLDKCFYIRPYWKTIDGTQVYGVSRYVSVKQGTDEKNVNIPVKLVSETTLQEGNSVGVTLTHYNLLNTTPTKETATVAKIENGYIHLNIPMTQVSSKYTSLNSATLITLDGTSNQAIYRNLNSSSKDVDVSWFRAYNKNSTFDNKKYVIATAADLYGFAEIVNLGSDNIQEKFFGGMEVQLCADIIVNSPNEYDATNVTTTPEKQWEAIGSGTSQFQGTFDGKNNTISGLYASSDATYVGLFGQDNSNAIYRNFKLENSYFQSTAAGGYIGGVAAYSKGNFENISSDAIISSTSSSDSNGVGGIIGQLAGDRVKNISNCSYTGKVASSSKFAGGFIGKITSTGSTTLDNCLNSGTVCYKGTGAEPNVGGFIGRAETSSVVTLSNSLNTGILELDMSQNTNTTMYFVGSVIGRVNNATVTFSNIYNTDTISVSKTGVAIADKDKIAGVGSGGTVSKTINGKPIIVTGEEITGTAGYALTKLDFKEKGIWAAIENGTPQLTAFATSQPLDLYGVHRIDTDWFNASDSTYTISTADELYGVAYLVNTKSQQFAGKTIQLGADIVINDNWNAKAESITEPEYSWTPIGVNRTFQGTFNGMDPNTGNIHTISGLYAASEGQCLGLFGAANASSVICNLKLENSYFKSIFSGGDGDRAFAGSLVGYTKGIVKNVSSDAIVVGQGFGIGGIIGSVTADDASQTKTISNCWFAGKVLLNTTNGRRGGGLIGTIGAGSINGGVVNIEHCLFTGSVEIPATGKGPQSGGIIGRIDKGTCNIVDTLSAGKIIGTDYVTQTGSIVGYICTGATLNLQDVYATKNIISCTASLLPSYNADATIGVNGTESGAQVTGSATVQSELLGKDGYINTTLDFVNYWVAVDGTTPQLRSFQTGTATDLTGVMQIHTSWYDDSKSEFTISTPAELYGLAYLVNTTGKQFSGKTIYLDADIQVNPDTWDANTNEVEAPEYSWTPIGVNRTFQGTFDGQNHTISGLYATSEELYLGLFGQANESSKICNVKLTNCYFATTQPFVGSIAGYTKGTIENVYSDAHIVSTADHTGGMVGAVTQDVTHNLTNCWYDGMIETTAKHCGGMTGSIWAGNTTIKDCLFTGMILSKSTNTEPSVGGLIGSVGTGSTAATVTIATSLSAGVIDHTGTQLYVGSLVGRNRYTSTLTFVNAYATEECYNKDTGAVLFTNDPEATSTGTSTAVLKDSILSENGSDVLTGFDFTNTWMNRSGAVPGLRTLNESLSPETALLDSALTLWSANANRASMKDYGAGNDVYVQEGIPKETYDTYCTKLENNGYSEYVTTNGTTGLGGTVYNHIYQKGELVLQVSFAGKATNKATGTVSISAGYGQPVSPYLVNGRTTVSNKVSAQTVENASFHMLKTSTKGNSFVIQLKNGHFIINDGGDKGELANLLNYLREQAGKTDGVQNPVIIEAWTISHFHTDHMALFRDILESAVSLKDVYVEGVYVNQPSNEKCDQDAHPMDIRKQIALFTHAIQFLRTTNGTAPQIYRYEAGQRYYFDDVTMDVLFTQDCLPTQAEKADINEFNDTSTWLQFTIEGKTILVAGDAEATSIGYAREVYGDAGFLQPDVFVAMHHGINTYATSYTYGIQLFAKGASSTQRVLVPQIDKSDFEEKYPTRYQNLTNNTNVNYRYWSGLGTVKLTFSGGTIDYAQTP